MIPSLSGSGVDCERCAIEPWLPDALGCGYSPRRPLPVSDDTMRSEAGLGPSQRFQRDGVAYSDLGFGEVRLDWDCCPRYHATLTGARMGGQLPAVFARRAITWRDKGSLATYLGGGEPTHATIQAIELTDALDAEQSRIDAERRESDRERRRRDRGT